MRLMHMPHSRLLTEPRQVSNKTFQGHIVHEATTGNTYIGESLQEYSLQVTFKSDYLCDVNIRPLNIQKSTYQINMNKI